MTAPYIAAIEDQIYHLKYFVKHSTPQQIIEKYKSHLFKYEYYMESDYSSFESCFSFEYVKQVELVLFKYFLQNNPTTYETIRKTYFHGEETRVVKLRNDDFIAYATECRLSGEMWTSLGNGFSNLMNMLYLCHKYDIKMSGLIEGDDGLFNLNKNTITPKDFADLGFTIKMKYVSDINETSFCGITYDVENDSLLANPEQIARMGWTCKAQYLHSRKPVLLSLMKAKAMSVYCTSPYTPILGPLALKIIQMTQGIDANFTGLYFKWIIDYNIKFKPVKIAMSTRIAYAVKFGISLDQQYICEDIIKRAQRLEDIRLPFYFLENFNTSLVF